MVKQYQGSNTFKFTWDKVVRAFWQRYPNPESKHVLTEDVVQRHVDCNGRLLTKRLLSKTNPCPKWAERFIAARSLFIIEESILDPVKKTLVTYTRNIGCLNYMSIEEKVVYRSTGTSDNWTVAERMAWIDSSYGYGISRAVQAFGYDRFRKNVAKATRGFQFVLDSMYGSKLVSSPSLSSPVRVPRPGALTA